MLEILPTPSRTKVTKVTVTQSDGSVITFDCAVPGSWKVHQTTQEHPVTRRVSAAAYLEVIMPMTPIR